MRSGDVLAILRLAAALAATGLLACTLDVRDLDLLRETARGPDKLQAIVRDASRTAPLRGEAALRLLDLTRRDVDGRALLLDALTALAAPARSALAPTLERGFSARLATNPGTRPSASAIAAKDAAVELLPLLEREQRERLGAALLRWVEGDIAHRADVGRFALEQIAARIGAASAQPSIDALGHALRPADLMRLIASIDAHGAVQSRELAAAKLVALDQRLRASPTRDAELEAALLGALGRFVSAESARRHLLAIAVDRSRTQTDRQRALELLRGHVAVADAEPLANVALDEAAPLPLRELALAGVVESDAREALPALLTLASSRERSLRQPAAEHVIRLGGERSLAALLKVLPSHWNMAYDESEIAAYVARAAELPPSGYLIALLGGKLYSPFWWCRAIAIRYLAQRASAVEASWRLRLHVDDPLEIIGAGWPANWTVGREANAALRELAQR